MSPMIACREISFIIVGRGSRTVAGAHALGYQQAFGTALAQNCPARLALHHGFFID
jgi:hypothetical protein